MTTHRTPFKAVELISVRRLDRYILRGFSYMQVKLSKVQKFIIIILCIASDNVHDYCLPIR